eukprot:scaffold223969_cov30-Tisochrysis_lutea.AAC.3
MTLCNGACLSDGKVGGDAGLERPCPNHLDFAPPAKRTDASGGSRGGRGKGGRSSLSSLPPRS